MDNEFQPVLADPVVEVAETGRSPAVQFAVDAIDRRIGRVAGALTGVADSLDELIERADPPVGEMLGGYAASASEGLRKLAVRAGDQDAVGLIGGVGRAAAGHPVVTVGAGAIVGAAIGLAVVALGRSKTGGGAQSPAI